MNDVLLKEQHVCVDLTDMFRPPFTLVGVALFGITLLQLAQAGL